MLWNHLHLILLPHCCARKAPTSSAQIADARIPRALIWQPSATDTWANWQDWKGTRNMFIKCWDVQRCSHAPLPSISSIPVSLDASFTFVHHLKRTRKYVERQHLSHFRARCCSKWLCLSIHHLSPLLCLCVCMQRRGIHSSRLLVRQYEAVGNWLWCRPCKSHAAGLQYSEDHQEPGEANHSAPS